MASSDRMTSSWFEPTVASDRADGRALRPIGLILGRSIGQVDLCTFDGRSQFALDRREVIRLQPLDLGQHGLHPPGHVGIVDTVAFQVGQQVVDLSGHALGGAGQRASNLALAEFGPLGMIDVLLAESPDLAQLDFERRSLRASLLLHLQRAAQFAQDQSLPLGQAIFQFLRGNDDQPPVGAAAGLRQIVGRRGVEGDLAARLEVPSGDFPAVLDDACFAADSARQADIGAGHGAPVRHTAKSRCRPYRSCPSG